MTNKLNENHYATLVNAAPDAEKNIAYCARVSNPNNQDNKSIAGLLNYCIKHKHWSIFEMSFMTIEINTNRGIAAQILRHRSFTFQEFSQRYADTSLLEDQVPIPDLRSQDNKNRQNSLDDLAQEVKNKYNLQMRELFAKSKALYDSMLAEGVAKECARFVLPLATPTRLYMSGSIRSWIHYIELRSENGTQKEHQDIALSCKYIFMTRFPIISEALGWMD
jgi:thymidylate synthase (FAD)